MRAVDDPSDDEARAQMLLAASYAGVGFGNAGVHLPHGMSYPVSGHVKSYIAPGYAADHPLVPHGMSVILNAPAVFRFTASRESASAICEAAEALGANVTGAKAEDAGQVLADRITWFMQRLKVPNGLKADRLLIVRYSGARRRHAAAASRDEAVAASGRPRRARAAVRGRDGGVVTRRNREDREGTLGKKVGRQTDEKHERQLDLRTALLPAWRTSNRITVELIEGLPTPLWSAEVPGSPRRTIRMIAAHLHNSRCGWIRTLGREHGVTTPERVDRYAVTRRQVSAALKRSSRGMEELLELGFAAGGVLPPSKCYVWRNLPLDVGHVLT